MNDIKSGEKKRLYLYDNLKFLLIVLVVLGHLIDDSTVKLFGDGGGETGVPQAKVFSGAFVFLYAFHMPLFLFISGLFNRGHDDGRKDAWICCYRNVNEMPELLVAGEISDGF